MFAIVSVVLWRQRASSEAGIFSRCCNFARRFQALQDIKVRCTRGYTHQLWHVPTEGEPFSQFSTLWNDV